jgi:iron complex transport system substrate-binding protein
MRKLCFVLLLSAFSAFAEIVSESGTELVFRQSDGLEVRLKKHPERVVIGYLSMAGVWDQAGGRAVGVLAGKNDGALPESMRDLPKVGSGMLPNVETVVSLKPDLVLLSDKIERHRGVARQLRGSGIAAVCLPYDNYRDYRDILDLSCRLNGKSVNDFPVLRAGAEEIDGICRKAQALKSPRCAIVFAAASGLSLESDATNSGQMAAMLGAENIQKRSHTRRLPFSYEQFLLEDPDVIFVVMMGEGDALRKKFNRELMSQPAWRELKAARNNRVHFLEPELFLFMAGADYPQAFRRMASLLYPGETF